VCSAISEDAALELSQVRTAHIIAVGRIHPKDLDAQTSLLLKKGDDDIDLADARHIIQAARNLVDDAYEQPGVSAWTTVGGNQPHKKTQKSLLCLPFINTGICKSGSKCKYPHTQQAADKYVITNAGWKCHCGWINTNHQDSCFKEGCEGSKFVQPSASSTTSSSTDE